MDVYLYVCRIGRAVNAKTTLVLRCLLPTEHKKQGLLASGANDDNAVPVQVN